MPFLVRKNFSQPIMSIVEDAVEFFSDDEVMGEIAEYTPFQGIMDDIYHFYAARLFLENVLVMPEAVGADTLFVYKKTGGNMGNLRYPAHRYTEKRLQAIGDNHARIHFFRFFGGQREGEPRRCDVWEIQGG